MTDYTVHAKRWGKCWELHVNGVGVTQCCRLTGAEEMARDYIKAAIGEDAGRIDIVPQLGGELDVHTILARKAVQLATEAQIKAAAESRHAVLEMHDAGLTGREIAIVLDLSEQRISQLLREAKRVAA